MWHGKSRRRISGGKVKSKRKKRKDELGRESLPCKVMDEDHRKIIDVRGDKKEKQRMQTASSVNLTDPETGETSKEEVEDVLENPANPHFVRRNIITKGSIIQTSDGKARVTSRPGQNGQINAVKVK
jgi:small subunit ribosomal protein S8e